MGKIGFISRIHRKKPKGRAMPDASRRTNSLKSKVHSHVEHVFAEQKSRMGVFIRTISVVRATTKIGLANVPLQYEATDLSGPHHGGIKTAAERAITARPASGSTCSHAERGVRRAEMRRMLVNQDLDRSVQVLRRDGIALYGGLYSAQETSGEPCGVLTEHLPSKDMAHG